MTSKERLLAAINGQLADHVPLTTWCFGFQAPKHLRWETNGREVSYWYSKRLEHMWSQISIAIQIHGFPQKFAAASNAIRKRTSLRMNILRRYTRKLLVSGGFLRIAIEI